MKGKLIHVGTINISKKKKKKRPENSHCTLRKTYMVLLEKSAASMRAI